MEVYQHQVGGHSRLMKLQDSALLFKPYSEAEFTFYERLDTLGRGNPDFQALDNLKQFLPKYFGVNKFHMPKKQFASFGTDNAATLSNSLLWPNVENVRSLNTTALRETRDSFKSNDSQQRSINKFNKNKTYLSSSVVTSDMSSTAESLKYIVLEDLVYMYKKPCVIDMKMGKRQRKIGASLEKEKRQLKKSFETTSYLLGFRVCGCQCYNMKYDTFYYRDKYWGRTLTKDKLLRLIFEWFWNGYVIYFELIVSLIRNLKVLYSCISKLRRYRFWSSSLLWVYDGGLSDCEERVQSLGVKMIDFANTIVLNDPITRDEEYLFGLNNLIFLLESLLCIVPASVAISKRNVSIGMPRENWFDFASWYPTKKKRQNTSSPQHGNIKCLVSLCHKSVQHRKRDHVVRLKPHASTIFSGQWRKKLSDDSRNRNLSLLYRLNRESNRTNWFPRQLYRRRTFPVYYTSVPLLEGNTDNEMFISSSNKQRCCIKNATHRTVAQKYFEEQNGWNSSISPPTCFHCLSSETSEKQPCACDNPYNNQATKRCSATTESLLFYTCSNLETYRFKPATIYFADHLEWHLLDYSPVYQDRECFQSKRSSSCPAKLQETLLLTLNCQEAHLEL